MSHVTYKLTGGLSRDEIQHMHDEALGLIERVGLRVAHEPTLRRIGGQQGVTISGDVVRFHSDLVQAAIAAQWYPEKIVDHEFAVNSGAYEMYVTDLQGGGIRPATYQDLVDLTKLCHSYRMTGSAPVRPLDLPPLLQELAMYKVSWEYSDCRPGGIFDANPISTVKAAEYIYEMAQAADKFFSLGLWIVSPFVATVEELEIIDHFRGRGLPLWVATMPVAGTTAPIMLPGAYVQSVAELLSGLTLIYLLAEGAPVYCSIIDSIRAYAFDMKYASFVYGSPEDLLATLIQIQLNAFYGIPVVAKSLLTTSKLPDAHAAAEKCAHTVAAALAGARMFTAAGLLAVDEIFSAEQLVIDHEIVQYARRVCHGFELDEEALGVRAIEEVGVGRHFLEHETTLAHYREATWDPDLFTHSTLRQWQAKGSPDLAARAREIAKKRIAAQGYVLDDGKQRNLEAIYQRAKRECE
ncbi:MAG: trimethylamine methyltransferase family protein [Anaerolineae bacterium]|nr:trimethylamine methyltransferase family protein [Anaerolineae bacterium]